MATEAATVLKELLGKLTGDRDAKKRELAILEKDIAALETAASVVERNALPPDPSPESGATVGGANGRRKSIAKAARRSAKSGGKRAQ